MREIFVNIYLAVENLEMALNPYFDIFILGALITIAQHLKEDKKNFCDLFCNSEELSCYTFYCEI